MIGEPKPRPGPILLVISTLGAGGAERALTELAAYLARRCARVIVATFDDEQAEDFYRVDYRVVRVKLGNPKPSTSLSGKVLANRRRVVALRRLIAAERPAVVLAFMEATAVLCLLAARSQRIPVVVAERTSPGLNTAVPLAWRAARWLLYRRARAVVAQTEYAAAWLREHCGVVAQVIPNAVREMPLAATSQREPLVLSVGRLSREKGFDVLLRAFAEARKSYPDWQLAIVGDGPLRDVLRSLAEDLGLGSAVQWVGLTGEVEKWYARASVAAQASRFEGFPNVILEAMATGLAVVSTDCRSGPRELISHGENGLLVPVDDAPALAQALRTLLADAPLRERLGSAATGVRDRFAADKVLVKWEVLLHRCMTPQANELTQTRRS